MILYVADTSNGQQVMYQSACCTSRWARSNAQGQAHSETSSNYLCTNGGLETGGMTPNRARGRPRSEERRDAVLTAAMELMQEDDLRRASIDRIAQRSGVSKATIYKWWPNRTAVAIDAFLHQMMADAPVPDTGSAAEDFRLTLRGMMGFYTSPSGAIYAQLIGEAQFYPTERERIRTHQVNLRRAAVTKIWHRGVARGELDPNVDPEVALDLIFAPAVYRMATGHAGLTPDDADTIVATAMRALAN
jgi:AcrR family transcriptional regulator